MSRDPLAAGAWLVLLGALAYLLWLAASTLLECSP